MSTRDYEEDTEVIVQQSKTEIDPIIELFQNKHIYANTTVDSEKADALLKIQSIVEDLKMHEWFTKFCLSAGIAIDVPSKSPEGMRDMQVDKESPETAGSTDGPTDEEKMSSIRTLFCSGNIEKACAEAEKVLGEPNRNTFKVDVCFACARFGIFYGNDEVISQYLGKVDQILENYTDWEQRNRYRVYEGLRRIRLGKYVSGVEFLLASVSTFRSTELMSYKSFITITVAFALVTLDRPTLKRLVIENSEITAMLQQIPSVHRELKAFHECKYADLFSAILIVTDELSMDAFSAPAVAFVAEEAEIRSLNQFLEAYQIVHLSSMATAFGINPDALEAKLFKHISAGRVYCRIDKRNDQVLAQEKDTTTDLYEQVMQRGEVVEAKLRHLSKILGV